MDINFLLENELDYLSDSMLLTSEPYEESDFRCRSEKRARQFAKSKFEKPNKEFKI